MKNTQLSRFLIRLLAPAKAGGSAFRLSPKPGTLLSCRVIVAIGFRVGHSSHGEPAGDRRSNLPVPQIDALREAVRRVRARAPFHIDAWVVLPDHMHCLWTRPPSM